MKKIHLAICGSSLFFLFACASQPKYQEVDVDEAIKYNSAMITSVSQNSDRTDFFNLIRSRGFYGVMKYIRIPVSQRLKKAIKTFIKK